MGGLYSQHERKDIDNGSLDVFTVLRKPCRWSLWRAMHVLSSPTEIHMPLVRMDAPLPRSNIRQDLCFLFASHTFENISLVVFS
jgi:hypothetical protein